MQNETPEPQTKSTRTVKDINLLPAILKPKKYALKWSLWFKKVIIIGLSVFIVAAVVALATFVLLTNRVDTAIARKSSLVAEIKSLEETEQKFILVKDRLSKIEGIYQDPTSQEEVRVLTDIVAKIPVEVFFAGASLSEDSTSVTFTMASSSHLAKLIATLVGSGSYKKIELVSLSYAPDTGYQMELAFTK